MKLEYLAEGSADCPLIRLFGFTPAEARELHSAISALAAGAVRRVEVHRLPFVQPIGDCRLVLVCRSWDSAIVRQAGAAQFECGFTAGTWENVASLVEPFAHGAGGFQWLAGVPGEATLVLSAPGEW